MQTDIQIHWPNRSPKLTNFDTINFSLVDIYWSHRFEKRVQISGIRRFLGFLEKIMVSYRGIRRLSYARHQIYGKGDQIQGSNWPILTPSNFLWLRYIRVMGSKNVPNLVRTGGFENLLTKSWYRMVELDLVILNPNSYGYADQIEVQNWPILTPSIFP